MPNTTLVLFTSSYPYGNGEQFLETELPYLSDTFSKIVIIPLEVKTGDIPRELADNCNSYPVQSYPRKHLMIRILGVCRSSWFWSEVVSHPRDFLRLFEIGLIMRSLMNQYGSALKFLENDASETILYSYWFGGHAMAIAALAKKNKVTRLVARAHRYDLYEQFNKKGYHPFKRFLLTSFNKLCPISIDGENYLKEKYPDMPTTDIATYKLGVVIPKKSKAYVANIGPIVIVSCSGIRPIKNVEKIAQSMRHLGMLCPDIVINWIHFGDGDHSIKNNIEKIVNDFSDNTTAHFKGNVSNPEVLEYYSTNDVFLFINLSSSEGIPVSIMEANSRSIPALATLTGGVGEIVNEHNGIPVPTSISATQVAIKIKELIDKDDYVYGQMRESAYDKVNEEYNATVNYPKFINEVLT
ncbi:MAG: glycosyltransferase [Saprospiraceae bacterium]